MKARFAGLTTYSISTWLFLPMKQTHTEPKSVKNEVNTMQDTRNCKFCAPSFPVLVNISNIRTVALKSIKKKLTILQRSSRRPLELKKMHRMRVNPKHDRFLYHLPQANWTNKCKMIELSFCKRAVLTESVQNISLLQNFIIKNL